MKKTNFDAVIVGGGHAGIEAMRVLSQRNLSVALVTLDPNKNGAMSCNPAIGGVAKGHLVYEIDALGGLMGHVADQASIQGRRLNMNKGPAVRSTRVQCDKDRYVKIMNGEISKLKNLEIIAGEAADILFEGSQNNVTGLLLKDGSKITCRAVIITAGTFMNGLMFCGKERNVGGRIGDQAALHLSRSLVRMGHELTRLKTGTPPRLDARSLDFVRMEKQWGDAEIRQFSWKEVKGKLPQTCCYITYTNEAAHEVIREHMHESPLFSGEIQGVGPRYCPSIEDKIKRFPQRLRHQIFIEPEGLDTVSIYPNGLSTSLSQEVQEKYLKHIPGLESVKLLRPGYAVEYDTINPLDLRTNFMSKFAQGLFLAGQVNRTSGYEEAASQGLWAGIGASNYLLGEEEVLPDRSRSYMETLVDDLTSKGTNEPYRMFTSRSEFRLLLREDNAQERLFSLADKLGLLSKEQVLHYEKSQLEMKLALETLSEQKVRLSKDKVITLYEYLKRPEHTWETIDVEMENPLSDLAIERAEIEAKYSGYLDRQRQELESLQKTKEWLLDPNVSLDAVPSLSLEVKEKYKTHKPRNVYELSRLSGITPTAVLNIVKVAGRKPTNRAVGIDK